MLRLRLMLTLTLSVLAATATLGSPASAAAPTPYGTNLVRDPGAERADPDPYGSTVVPLPNWHATNSFTAATYHSNTLGYPTKAESKRIGGGKNFFTCGPNDAQATAQQVIALSGHNTVIDSGKVHVKISARIASYDTQGDRGRVKVWMLDATDLVIETVNTAWVENTNGKFVARAAHHVLALGTRSLEVVLEGQRTGDSDTYCDAYFDNIIVRLAKT